LYINIAFDFIGKLKDSFWVVFFSIKSQQKQKSYQHPFFPLLTTSSGRDKREFVKLEKYNIKIRLLL
jgi:hypothetical protein